MWLQSGIANYSRTIYYVCMICWKSQFADSLLRQSWSGLIIEPVAVFQSFPPKAVLHLQLLKQEEDLTALHHSIPALYHIEAIQPAIDLLTAHMHCLNTASFCLIVDPDYHLNGGMQFAASSK